MHGGNRRAAAAKYGVDPASLTDFSTGINARGFPPYIRPLADSVLSEAAEYPDPDYGDFRRAAAAAMSREPGEILPGNGTSELIPAMLRALSPPRIILPVPCYVDYERYARHLGIPVHPVPLDAAEGFRLDADRLHEALAASPVGSLAIIGNPNNPTGRRVPDGLIPGAAGSHPDKIICADEAYRPFVDDDTDGDAGPANLIILRSLTKIFAVPGIRLGYLAAREDLTERIARELPIWNVGTLAARLGEALLSDRNFPRETREVLAASRVSPSRAARVPTFQTGSSRAIVSVRSLRAARYPRRIPGTAKIFVSERRTIRLARPASP